MSDTPPRRIHVVINPASGKDEPILNVLNDVFRAHDVDWDISITKKYGDATEQARAAAEAGVDIVAGYGGDGTQHEIANGILRAAAATGRLVPMGILPGGTGNGFATELGIPSTLRAAVEAMCASRRLRAIDVARIDDIAQPQGGDRYVIQRLYLGIEPEEQASRELKNRYGVFAYAVAGARRRGGGQHAYRAVVDGEVLEFEASKVYLVNSGMMGTGLQITDKYAIDDGLLDAFAYSTRDVRSLVAAADRLLALGTSLAGQYYRQCRTATIEAQPDQPVWADGEYIGRTPVTVTVQPGALAIVAP